MEDILVSVIIPTYSRPDFLSRAVLSVVNQSYKNIEIIVVDDNGAGTDLQIETERIINELQTVIHYVPNEVNIGGANSRNRGAQLAKGEYLCFLDDDDIFLEDKIRDQLEFMKKNNLDLSFTDIKMKNSEGKTVDIRVHDRYMKSFDNESLLVNHLKYHLTPTDTYMFRKDAFFKTDGFRQRTVSQEFVLMLECIEKGLKIGYLKGIYAVQYIHGRERISSSKDRRDGDRRLFELKREYFPRLKNKDVRFIKFRYFAVLAVYYLRAGKPFSALKYLAAGFFTSPLSGIKEAALMLNRFLTDK